MIRYELYDKDGDFIRETDTENDIDFESVGYVDKVSYDENDNLIGATTIYDWTDTENSQENVVQKGYRYTYNGPVYRVYSEGEHYWGDIKLTTIAQSDAKAISNIKYQIRQIMGVLPNVNVRIDNLQIKRGQH